MNANPIKVLVVDDDPLACEAIRVYLVQSGLEVVGIGKSGREAVRMTEDLSPDVLLLDRKATRF